MTWVDFFVRMIILHQVGIKELHTQTNKHTNLEPEKMETMETLEKAALIIITHQHDCPKETHRVLCQFLLINFLALLQGPHDNTSNNRSLQFVGTRNLARLSQENGSTS